MQFLATTNSWVILIDLNLLFVYSVQVNRVATYKELDSYFQKQSALFNVNLLVSILHETSKREISTRPLQLLLEAQWFSGNCMLDAKMGIPFLCYDQLQLC